MDISKITDTLFIAAHPGDEDAQMIHNLNVRLILNMIFIRPAEAYKKPPFKMLTLRTFDSIFLPIPTSKLWEGVGAALPVIQRGETVLIYCREGRHRSVAMGAAILVALGYNSDDAMRLIKERREKADPYAWHISRVIKKFEKEWKARQPV